MRRIVYEYACIVALSLPAVAAAQDTVVVRGGLDASSRVAREAVRFFNARSTTRIFGTLNVARDDVFNGNVAVLDGPLRLSGVIRGDLVAINADVWLRRTAVVRGDVLVVGGSIRGITDARILGSLREYGSRVRLRRVGDEIELLRPRREPRRTRSRDRLRRSRDGRFEIVLSTAGTYNRVEGLPFHAGAQIEWGIHSLRRFRIEGVGIVRTAGDFQSNPEDLGYRVRAEMELGRRTPVTLGARAYDVVAPIEDWQLQDDEIGFASLLWHRDYRDYYLKKGVAGFISLVPFRRFTLSAEIARNEESSVAERDPWTLFRRDRLWRANPTIDEGRFTYTTVRAEYDSRPHRRSGSSGWFLSAAWERGESDDVTPEPLPATIRAPLPTDGSYTFERVFVDLRRYERVGWAGQLSLRALAAGTVGDDPLPIQRRLSLGGPDPMPGFPFRRFACNESLQDPSVPALCDRILLLQAEYRGELSFGASFWDRRHTRRTSPTYRRDDGFRDLDDWHWFEGPTIVLFGDAGQGWIGDDRPDEFDVDVGAGLEFGSVGVYGAKALTEGEEFRVILRIHRRF